MKLWLFSPTHRFIFFDMPNCLELGGGRGFAREMRGVSDSRAIWLAQHVLPHEADLRRWLRRRIPAGLDIDDVVQETYAKLTMLAEVDHIAAPKAYVYQTALSVILQESRRARTRRIDNDIEIELLKTEAPEPLQDQQIEARQELAQVYETIAALPEKCREVFILRKIDGLSQREIAEKLHLSESTVEKHIGRGIRRLIENFGRGGRSGTSASSSKEAGGRSDDEG